MLRILPGRLTTYGDIAERINQPKAFRRVGTAIGKNPVACLISCHRVIQQSGKAGEYRWNPVRKKAIIDREVSMFKKE